MERRIEKGDTVFLQWSDGNTVKATVIHTPKGCGDSWQVEYEDGRTILVNVYASDFAGMTRMEKDAG